MTNRLATETSPYLLQHAENPVDWYPWSEEALTKALREDKLIFLSIGYSACHWCHVMEHESFEDVGIAAQLNEHFIPIKVDREERPDLDEIYMSATMLFSGGHGGWPMSVFLAPDLKPIYAGTYFPKNDAYGRPGFSSLLRIIIQKWTYERSALNENADKVVEALNQIHRQEEGGSLARPELVNQAADMLVRAFDPQYGGIASGSNKFPQSFALELLLRTFHSSGQKRYLQPVELTLEKVANGGIYDHLGGGLHRYSTDTKWLVPHYEKMLYDQALVASIFLDASRAIEDKTKRDLFRARAQDICDYVLRDLKSPEGAFYSSEDADSEGKEGLFYIWTRDEIIELLDKLEARLFASCYDISESGNWNHPGDAHVPSGPKNVLQVVRSAETLARLHELPLEEVENVLSAAKRKLYRARCHRIRPGLDDKVLTGWNGLMITALAKAASLLQESSYGEAAVAAANFLLDKVRQDDRLLASYGKGVARLKAYSTDYAFLVEGLIEIYCWNGETEYLQHAEQLTETLIEYYWDQQQGGFYLTASDHERLLVRTKTVQDGATPSANSSMAMNLQKLSILLNRDDYKQKAETILRVFIDSSLRKTFQQELLLSALDAWHRGWEEIVILGAKEDEHTKALLTAGHANYRPNQLIVQVEQPGRTSHESLPLLQGRKMIEGQPTVYLCHNYVCKEPITAPQALLAALSN